MLASGRNLSLVAGGAFSVLAGRKLLRALILTKLRCDVERLNAGDSRPILAPYTLDAVLSFDDGEHRWSGRHAVRTRIERFFHELVRAGLQGKVCELWLSGPPWAATLIVLLDDAAASPADETLYANQVVIVARTQWGRIIDQEDFYADTRRIDAFEAQLLREQGITPQQWERE